MEYAKQVIKERLVRSPETPVTLRATRLLLVPGPRPRPLVSWSVLLPILLSMTQSVNRVDEIRGDDMMMPLGRSATAAGEEDVAARAIAGTD
jgi:hypothetical protein